MVFEMKIQLAYARLKMNLYYLEQMQATKG